MGNANCTKCLQDCDGGKEIDLKPSVLLIQIILRAFGNLRDPSIDSVHKRPQRSQKPQASAYETECIIKLQSYWRVFSCQKQYSLIKRIIKQNHPYFSQEELRYTISSKKPNKKSRTENFSYPSGAYYKGDWLGGFRHGFGIMTWPDNSQYQGTWSYGYPYGFGKFTFSDKDSYSGEWKSPYSGANFKPASIHPNTSLEFTDGYNWLWHKNIKTQENAKTKTGIKTETNKILQKIQKRIDEQANYIQETKSLLQEVFLNFEQKFSPIELEGGAHYWGEIISGKRAGRGVNRWENGDKYSGDWLRDLQHGKGWNVWVDGSSYIGGYKDGVKDGTGEYIWEDGTKYLGEWKDNNIEGIGKYIWSDGREYYGEWTNGVMHGFGVFTSKDGKKYMCPWVNGKKHGPGTTSYKDGKVTQDTWDHGKIVKSSNQ